jgi:aminoglycoside 3-N-acetyltransferase
MLTKLHIQETLEQNGVRPGDHLLVHSSLRSIGPIDGGPDAFIEGLLETVSLAGTIAMPAFNYTRPLPSPYFDVLNTPSKAGALTEIFRQRFQTVRSVHPTHSVAARGERAADFLADHRKSLAFGIGSPIDRLAQAGGYVLLVGVTQLANSSIHIGEAHAGVTKFFWEDGPLPTAKILMSDGRVVEHQLDCSTSCSVAFNAVEYPLRRNGLILDLRLGQALCFLMKGIDVIRTTAELLRETPDLLFCKRDQCRPCRMARRHLEEKNRI